MKAQRLRVSFMILLLVGTLVLFAVGKPKGEPSAPKLEMDDCIESGPYCEWPENDCYVPPFMWPGTMQTCKVDWYCPEKMTVACTPPDDCPCRFY